MVAATDDAECAALPVERERWWVIYDNCNCQTPAWLQIALEEREEERGGATLGVLRLGLTCQGPARIFCRRRASRMSTSGTWLPAALAVANDGGCRERDQVVWQQHLQMPDRGRLAYRRQL